MLTENFQSLIRLITGRDFSIKTHEVELRQETEYIIYRVLPITNRTVSFAWKTPKNEEKFLRSFITAFTSKYREPNPRAYDYMGRVYGSHCLWENKSDKDKEHAYYHHASNMFSKADLLKQVEGNFSNKNITAGLLKYGFYATEYGIGIFCFWPTAEVCTAINTMKQHLNQLNIPFKNQFSDAKWVYRFLLGLSKDAHTAIIGKLN